MTKEKWADKENKFWEGSSSLDEERQLKSNMEDPFFRTLPNLQEEKMDWAFEDFMQQVKEMPNDEKKIIPFFQPKRILWAAASVAILFFLTWIALPNSKKTDIQPNIAISSKIVPTDTSHKIQAMVSITSNKAKKPNTQNRILASNNGSLKKLRKHHWIVVKPTSIPKVVPETDRLDDYQPQYVLINGKPVYSEKEAIEVTQQSLQLLASNVHKSVTHLSVVKELSIHF